jgi:hypothetical protein
MPERTERLLANRTTGSNGCQGTCYRAVLNTVK